MPNPNGTNQFDRFASEPKYGDVKRDKELQRAAPLPSNPAVTAPQTYQAKATNPPERRVSPSKPQIGPQGTPPPYEQELALTWAEIAAQPGASELVKAIAARAMNRLPRAN